MKRNWLLLKFALTLFDNHVKIYLHISLLVLIPSCKNKDPYVLKGRLMVNCDYPGANKEMFIKQDVSMLNNGGVIKESFYSDENGYFEVEYIPEHSGDLKLGVYGSSTVLEFIPSPSKLIMAQNYESLLDWML